MQLIRYPSPNFGDRRGDGPVDMLVLHYTDMVSAQEALDRLCDPAAEVSAHYLIDEDGRVYQMVDEDKRAWHAGVSFWRGCRDVNSRSIGIELANPGHLNGYRPFPSAQMESLARLCRSILARHPIEQRNVIAHSDVAPGRKKDPGELFQWRWLSKEGVGRWPELVRASDRDLIGSLAEIGYCVDDEAAAIEAFQRHYRPDAITGEADEETRLLAAGLLETL
mgnify:CR=1 FL=1